MHWAWIRCPFALTLRSTNCATVIIDCCRRFFVAGACEDTRRSQEIVTSRGLEPAARVGMIVASRMTRGTGKNAFRVRSFVTFVTGNPIGS